jgi:hypothetical protein
MESAYSYTLCDDAVIRVAVTINALGLGVQKSRIEDFIIE